MAERVLELEFKDLVDKSFKLRVDEPKEELTAVDYNMAMNSILESKVFTNRGVELASIDSARIITTTVTEFDLA